MASYRVCTRAGFFNDSQLTPSFNTAYPYCTTATVNSAANWVLFQQWKDTELTSLKEFNNFTSIQLRIKAGTSSQTAGKVAHFFMSSTYTANGTSSYNTDAEKNAAFPKTVANAQSSTSTQLVDLGTFTSTVTDQYHYWTFDSTACAKIQRIVNAATNIILWVYATNTTNSSYTFGASGADYRPIFITTGSYVDTSFTISPSSSSVVVGNTIQLSTSPAQSEVTWTSSNTSVATVSSSGVVTAKAAGSATITAQTSAASATATITVSASSGSSGTITTLAVPEHSFFLTATQTTLNLSVDNPSNLAFSSTSWNTYLYEAKNTATTLSGITGASTTAFGATASITRVSATTTPPVSLTITSKTDNRAYGRITNNITYSGAATKTTYFYYHIGDLKLYYNNVVQSSSTGNNIITINAGETLHFTSILRYTSCADDVTQWRNGVHSFVWPGGANISYSNYTGSYYGTGGNSNECYTYREIDLTFPKAGSFYIKPYWGINSSSENRIFSDAICHIIVLPKTPIIYYRISENGTATWKPCTVYYRQNGEWIQCEPYYRLNGEWKELIKA